MTFRQMAVASLSVIFAAAAGVPAARAQEALPSEYQMKAAYLYNFGKFVDWPTASLPTAAAPMVIGVLGQDPFDGVLDGTIRNKEVNGHPLVVHRLTTASEAKNCHILFISNSEKKHWPDIQNALGTNSVLTVSENWDRFTQDGGMIYFFMEGKKVCFDINDAAAKHAGLKISSKLMQLKKKPAE